MASSARKIKATPIDDNQLKLLYGDDALTKYWSSSLFNTVYLRHDIADKHSCWKDDDSLEFQNFMNTLRNLATEYKDREKELLNWSETETINNWVKHVLHALGWTNNCTGVQNPFLEETSFRYDGKTYRTDILIVDHPKEKQYINQAKGDDKLTEARQSILMPVEVKYWQRLEEFRQGKKEEKKRTDNEVDDLGRTTTPNEQTVQYMDVLKKSWGILTDGARWRLFNSELSSEDAERYYEFSFISLFQAMCTEETEADSLEIIEAAKYFYHFFSKFAFHPKNEGERPFVDEILQYSKKYVNKVEEDLKDRFVKAMNIACNGFFKSAKQNGLSKDLSVIRNVSESALFNILFIKSLESRGVLPMASTDYKKISLSSIIDKIERFDPEKDELLNIRELERAFKKGNGNSFSFKPNDHELHDRILRLTAVIHKGASTKDSFGFEIAGFRESVFSDDEWAMFKTCKISNHDWVRILFELGYAESESLNRKFQQIPYAYFTPRQLGSIYESFLEFKLEKADCDMIYEKRQWKKADLNSQKYRNAELPKVVENSLFFTPNNRERKASGSYYTPDFVVQSIIAKTIEPLLKNQKAAAVLNLKVCDPAMGSGHFLVGAVNQLSKAYLTKLYIESEGDLDITFHQAKQKVLSSCVFGVDINPRAVKLAKMSLWLESASINQKLEHLEDQLKCGNSLNDDFKWRSEFKDIFQSRNAGFDAIVANPPYVGEADNANIFRDLSNSKIYQYHLGKMDYWYFFCHLAMDLLKDQGRLGLIATDYWMTNSGANKLRAHLSKYKLDRYISFKDYKIFKQAKGQHNMIMFVVKDDHAQEQGDGYILQNSKEVKEEELKDDLNHLSLFKKVKIEFANGSFVLEDGSEESGSIVSQMQKSPLKLADIADLSQGFTPNPDKVNSRNIKKLPKSLVENDGVRVGDGVFVVTQEEFKKVCKTKSEQVLAKPYIEAKDICNGSDIEWNKKKLILYLTEQTCPQIKNLKSLSDHLAKFKPIMNERRETQQGRREWFHLHWPKDESFFSEAGIVSVRMTKDPCFAWSSGEKYFDLAVNIIRAKDKAYNRALFFYLSSEMVKKWLMKYGSFKGDQLQMDGKPLEKIPVPDFSLFKGNAEDKKAVLKFCEDYFKNKVTSKMAA
jgi:adenine-specific DNA-methyltransferase